MRERSVKCGEIGSCTLAPRIGHSGNREPIANTKRFMSKMRRVPAGRARYAATDEMVLSFICFLNKRFE